MSFRFNPFTGTLDLIEPGIDGLWSRESFSVGALQTVTAAHTPIYEDNPPLGNILLGLRINISSNRVGTTGVRNQIIEASITTAGEIRYSKSNKLRGQVASQYFLTLVNSAAVINGVNQSTVALMVQNLQNDSHDFIIEKIATYRINN